MPNGRIRVVLFDLDGTLVRAGGSGRKALDRAAKKLYGVPNVCSLFSLAGRTDKQNFHLAHFKATGRRPKKHHLTALEQAYLKCLPAEVRRAVRNGSYQEIPGISRLLKALSARKDVMLGLGTGNIVQGAQIKLEPSGFLRYFAFGGYGADSHSRVRMLKKGVRCASALLGKELKPNQVYIIGDTPRDVQAGKKAGYHTGAVTGGYGKADEIAEAKPDFIAENFIGARHWLRWILKR